MHNRHPQPVEDHTTANMMLIFVNLLWIFVAMWSAWGLGPVILLALALNHMITRFDQSRRARGAAPKDNGPKDARPPTTARPDI